MKKQRQDVGGEKTVKYKQERIKIENQQKI